VQIRGARLLIARDLEALSERALAALAGVSHVTIGKIERGQARTTRAEILEKLAAALHVTPAWLRGETSIPIVSTDWWVGALEKTGRGLEWEHLELRRWRALARCVHAVRRDYLQLHRVRIGDELPGAEGELMMKFWGLFEGRWLTSASRASAADGRGPDPCLTPSPWITLQTQSASPGRSSKELAERQEAEALLRFWEVALQPWWQGRVGFNFGWLASILPPPPAREGQSSPREAFASRRPKSEMSRRKGGPSRSR
jgi:transcriptional regulator with XRE-family HTH domain